VAKGKRGGGLVNASCRHVRFCGEGQGAHQFSPGEGQKFGEKGGGKGGLCIKYTVLSSLIDQSTTKEMGKGRE